MYTFRVLDLAREMDLERLRQMARLLEAENTRLHQRLGALTRQLAEARGEDRAQLELELQHLTEQLAARNRQLFGDRSERRSRGPRDQPAARAKAQQMVAMLQDSLYEAEPKLGQTFKAYFAATVHPEHLRRGEEGVVELRIMPSELLHIEVLQKLVKYAH